MPIEICLHAIYTLSGYAMSRRDVLKGPINATKYVCYVYHVNAIDNAIMYMLSGYAIKKCYRIYCANAIKNV